MNKEEINISEVPQAAKLPSIQDLRQAFNQLGGNSIMFETKDSGERQSFSTGMVRDIQTNKPRYDLIGSGWNLIRRWAELMGRGAIKYGEFNFEQASTQEELNRFRASALRHMIQWFQGDQDEDHASAVCFNLAGAEMVKEKLNNHDRNLPF